MTAYISIVVAVIGLLMFFVSGNPKVEEVGKIMFWTGLLAFLLQVSTKLSL